MRPNVEHEPALAHFQSFPAYEHHVDYLAPTRLAESFVAGIDLQSLEKLGISRSLDTKFWPAHTIVTYPFFENLESNNNIPGSVSQIEQAGARSANIYVHIPFCTGICEYCAYARVAARQEEKVDAYISALQRELKIWERMLGGQLPTPLSLYVGGGTPTSIPTRSLENLMQILVKTFGVSDSCGFQCTCEVSPETVADESEGRSKLKVLRSVGVTRISMGVQSFSDELASSINRRHTALIAVKAIENIRESGIENINIDLMYGLPGQDLKAWINSLVTAIELRLPSITMHQLKVKNKSQLAAPKNLLKTAGWSQRESLLFATLGRLILEQAGYTQLGVYRYVRNEQSALRYRTQDYRMTDLLGLGSSSYSFLAHCTTYNIFNQFEYIARVGEGTTALAVGRPLTSAELRVRYLIYGLRCGISQSGFAGALGRYAPAALVDHFPIVPVLQDRGLIEVGSDEKYRLSTLGFLFANEIGLALASTQASTLT
jgi:oxygen-independent coproporphyrinogen III oxidase